MERLWSPWRLSYVTGATSANACVFCAAAAEGSAVGRPDAVPDALVLVRGEAAYVILNLYPYNNAHMLVVPNRHVDSLTAATDDELAELMRLTRDAEAALHEAYRPEGINVGINLGRPAGAGIADHLHIHIVPRWTGDTNFMSVVGRTRVLPETLDQTASRLRPILEQRLGRQEAGPRAGETGGA